MFVFPSGRFEIRLSSESKIGMNAAGVHFLQLYRKKKYDDPNIIFHGFSNNTSFNKKTK